MNISETDVAIIRSVLKDCANEIEKLSVAATGYHETTFFENLLIDIDRSINILTDPLEIK